MAHITGMHCFCSANSEIVTICGVVRLHCDTAHLPNLPPAPLMEEKCKIFVFTQQAMLLPVSTGHELNFSACAKEQ